MRRILLLNTDLEIGGTPTVVRELAIRLNRAGGAVVDVACLSKWGPVADQLRDAGVTVHAFGARGPRDVFSTVARLRLLGRQRRFDTVFSFLVHANVVAAAGSRSLRDVRLLQSIQTTQPLPRWHWLAQSAAQLAAEKVVVPSDSVATVARDRAHVPADKIVVIPNAIDPTDFIFEAATSASPIHVGFIGRLDPIKRVPLLVSAVAKLGDGFHLAIYGEGPDRANVERAILAHSLTSRVTLHGAIAQPQAALSTMHVLALPSLAEGFGLVLIEAMAAGVPVVAADAPGIRDVVRHGMNGLLVDPTDAGEFADAIRRATGADHETLVMGGLRDVRERFTWDVVLPQYQRLLGISSGPSPSGRG